MSTTNPAVQSAVAHETSPDAQPLYFGPADAKLFGWLHEASSGAGGDLGLVICQPFGYEAACSHQSIRALAEKAAAAGIPALRFDYLGTGDSADIDPQADQLDAWSRDTLAAVGELKRLTGVKRVSLLGIRLGALLAATASTQDQSVVGLILISPIVKGRRYLRDLRITRLASMSPDPTTAPATPQSRDSSADDGSLEVSGFTMSAATVAALAKTDLTTLRSNAQLLIIDGDTVPMASDWAKALTSEGRRVEYAALPGLVEMVMAVPHDAKPSASVLEATRLWLRRVAAETATVGGTTRSDQSLTRLASLELPGDDLSASITEQPVFLSAKPRIFAILTTPHVGQSLKRAVVLINAGATFHAGPNRFYVSLSRRWARSGYSVLRMDLSGLGDSDAHAGHPKNEVFPIAALNDMRSAIEFLRTRLHIDDITLCGFCSGGYHALRAAAAELHTNRILIVNPENFFWKAGADIHALQPVEVVRRTRDQRERILSAAKWKKLFTGQVDLLRIVKVYAQRPLLGIESHVREWARFLRLRLPRDLGWELEAITARGAQVVFVFAQGEGGIDLLRMQAGSSLRRVGDRCRIHIIDGADHIFSSLAPRTVLERLLNKELGRSLEQPIPTGPDPDPKASGAEL